MAMIVLVWGQCVVYCQNRVQTFNSLNAQRTTN